jgi:type IV pilus assembly protein PilW
MKYLGLHLRIASRPHKRSQSKAFSTGLTLIELMVGVALGIVLVTGVISIFTSNQQNSKLNSDLARLQESARFAYEQMNREIRDAGTNPCGVRAVNSVVRASGATIPWWGDWNAGTLRGFDSGESVGIASSISNRVTGTDAILVLRTINDDGQLRSINGHNVIPDQFILNGTQRFTPQDLAFVCDNTSGAIFEVNTASAAATNPPVISYETSAPSANCSTSLGWAANVNCNANAVPKTFTAGSFLTKFDPAIWYIGLNSTGQRALFRESIHKVNTPAAIVTTEGREYVPDVHDMQIQYLMRTKSTDPAIAPTLASNWVDASVINAQAGAWGSVNLAEAVAVRIVLTFQSDTSSGIDGTTATPLQRTSISVISLRNRELVR